MAIHELKIWSEYFNEVRLGLKKAEFRRDVDRRFHAGDVVKLIEIKRCSCHENTNLPVAHECRITGNVITCLITSVVVVNDVYEEFTYPGIPTFVMFSFYITGMELSHHE